MQEMPRCLVLLCTLDQEHVKVEREEQASITHMVIQALLKQSVERIARLREVSCCCHCVLVVTLHRYTIHLVVQVMESLTAYVVWSHHTPYVQVMQSLTAYIGMLIAYIRRYWPC